MNDEASKKESDQKRQLAFWIIGIVAILIGISLWLAGRRKDRDRFSYDNLRRMIFGDDRG